MKILYVTTVIGTINAFLIPHIELLTSKGYEVDVAANTTNGPSSDLTKLGCKIYNIEFQRYPLKKDNYIAYKKIKKLVSEEKYDLVHVHTPVASFLTRLACRNIPNLKVIYTVHGFHFFKGAPLKNWLLYYPMEKLAARWTDGIITINKEDYETASKMKFRILNSIYHIHGVGIDLHKFSPPTIEEKRKLRKEYGFNNKDFILFYAAELNYNKHQDLLINVISLLKNKIPNIKLLLAGNGNLKGEYEKLINTLDLDERVQILGYRRDIPNLLKISDVAVASSRREGLPVNVMEAMATGLPLVVTNCRGQRDLVNDGENGFIVEIEDIQGFAKAIEKLYKDKELRIKFGLKSIEFSEIYSLNEIIKELEGIYLNYLDIK